MSEETDASSEALARFLCVSVGIEPIDSIDGSSNWWMFYNEAKKIVDDLRERGFTPLWKYTPDGTAIKLEREGMIQAQAEGSENA